MRPGIPVALGVVTMAIGGATAAAPDATAGPVAGHERMSERQLQRLERRVLGAAHAHEHRIVRRADRRNRARWRRMSPAQRRRAQRPLARLAATGDPASEGRWTAPFEMPVVGVHAAVLPTGKVMLFSQRVNNYREHAAAAYLWDPAKAPGAAGEFEMVTPPVNIWCGAQSLLADGQLLVTGGNLDYASSTVGFKGLKTVLTFDPWSETWTRQPDMARGRWYPTQTLLPDGRTMITSGYDETGSYGWNTDIDVFNPPASRGGVGTITRIGRYGQLAGAPAAPHWYPHWFVMPSGGVLNAGFKRDEAWLLDPTPGAVTGEARPHWSMHRKYGSAVLLPGTATGSTRVMQLGGYDHSTPEKASVASTEIFDEAKPTQKPAPGPAMQVPRSHQNTVLLPDRSIVNIGGGTGEQPGTAAQANDFADLAAANPEHKQVEILDAGSDSWRLGAAQRHKRSYHSTAVLLPDGRVLSAGDDRDPSRGAGYLEKDQAEIYEPAYLHKPGPRPAIVAAPGGIDFGQRFGIETDSAISSAVLIAPGTTTHANDMNQRLVPLQMTARSDGRGAELTAPPSANVAPPGHYMLFALSPDGKPSVARWVRLGAAGSDVQLPAASVPADPVPAPVPASAPRNSAPRDTTAPRATVTRAVTVRQLHRRGRLVVKVRMSEAGTARVSASVAKPRSFAVRLPRRGTRMVRFTRAQTRSIGLAVTRSDRRRLGRETLSAKVTVHMRDRAGNEAERVVRLRLPR